MELKHKNMREEMTEDIAFNRTFMELKLSKTDPPTTTRNAFNRTFMELKLDGFIGIVQGIQAF